MSVLSPERTLPVAVPARPEPQAEPHVFPEPVDPTTEALIKARALIEKGWTKGKLFSKGKYCTEGAILAATRGSLLAGTFPHAVFNRLLEHLPGYRVLYLFNDSPHTTKRDVLNLFDRAIANKP